MPDTQTSRPTLESLVPRFWAKVDVRGPNDCWPWTACLGTGYGRIAAGFALGGPRIWFAHRVSYVLHVGPIGDAELDHVCHTLDPDCVAGGDCLHRRCVNPAHLEPVTHQENALRRVSRIPTCPRGHAKGVVGNRGGNGGPAHHTKCRVCHRTKMAHWRATGIYAWPTETAVSA